MHCARHFAWASLTLLFVACAAHSSGNAPAPPASANARVVTLVPSFADDLSAIGAVSQLVGVSVYTDAPHTDGLPRVADATSVNAEAILTLKPSVVVGIPAQSRLVEPLRRARIPVVLLPDDSYESIFANLREMGSLTAHRREAAATISRLQRETAQLHQRTAHFVHHPSVFVVLGGAPIWTAGNRSYITTLIALAGAVNSADDLDAAYGEYSSEALLRHQPDLVIADHATNLLSVLDREPWRGLRAVQLHRVYFFDPDVIERPGPNYNEGLQWLLERVSPLAKP